MLFPLKYEDSLNVFRDWKNIFKTARMKGYEKGRQEGFARGLKEGLIEANREKAKRMKSKGFPITVISEITGLSIEVIEQL